MRKRRKVRILSVELVDRVAEAGTSVSGGDEAGKLIASLIGHKDREHLLAVHLDVTNRVVAVETVAIGQLSAALVHLREVFKAAILANAASIIISHNHPSGDMLPSREDVEISCRLVRAGEILGISVVDFLVGARDAWRSGGEP